LNSLFNQAEIIERLEIGEIQAFTI
jgi:hypothetical protein